MRQFKIKRDGSNGRNGSKRDKDRWHKLLLTWKGLRDFTPKDFAKTKLLINVQGKAAGEDVAAFQICLEQLRGAATGIGL